MNLSVTFFRYQLPFSWLLPLPILLLHLVLKLFFLFALVFLCHSLLQTKVLPNQSSFFSKLKKKWGEKRNTSIWHQTLTCKVTFLFAYLDTLESGKSVFTLILGNMYLFCFVWKWVFRMLTRIYIFNLSVFVLYGLGEN